MSSASWFVVIILVIATSIFLAFWQPPQVPLPPRPVLKTFQLNLRQLEALNTEQKKMIDLLIKEHNTILRDFETYMGARLDYGFHNDKR